MIHLKQAHFYYGAILSALMEYNPDATMILIQPEDESRRIFKIQTNTAQQECILFLKHAFEKSNKASTWVFSFSENDKAILKQCYDQKIPVFIYLLCARRNLINSTIAVLHYDEYMQFSDKRNITVSHEKQKRFFSIARGRSPKNNFDIPVDRIERTFDDLINEIVEVSHGYYCPKCGNVIAIE